MMGRIIAYSLLFVAFLAMWSFVDPFEWLHQAKFNPLGSFWVKVSDTGTEFGAILSTIMLGAWLAYKKRAKRNWLKTFFLFTLSMLLLLKLFSIVNEEVLKAGFRYPRPSLLYLQSEGILNVDSVYGFTERKKRSEYIRERIESAPAQSLNKLNSHVLDHWIKTTGYSFPSGHAQHSFLLCSLIFAVLAFNTEKKYLWITGFPLFWALLVAVSRVGNGVHTPLDVTIGALIGCCMALITIATPVFKKLVIE
jgi:phosphatidylglycerophosphatase B